MVRLRYARRNADPRQTLLQRIRLVDPPWKIMSIETPMGSWVMISAGWYKWTLQAGSGHCSHCAPERARLPSPSRLDRYSIGMKADRAGRLRDRSAVPQGRRVVELSVLAGRAGRPNASDSVDVQDARPHRPQNLSGTGWPLSRRGSTCLGFGCAFGILGSLAGTSRRGCCPAGG